MLTSSEQKLVSQIFWILFILSASCTIGGLILTGVAAVYAVQAAIMYFRIAREDWHCAAGLRTQLYNSQRFYWLFIKRIFSPDAAADQDQRFLDLYGGRQTFWQHLSDWSKRLLRGIAALLVWLPAIILHGLFLCVAALGNIMN